MKKALGFTLIELMIVVAVIAILAVIAISQYGKQVRKSKRAEAKQAISTIAMGQEKWRMNHATYGTCDEALAPGTCASFNGSLSAYTVAVSGNTATGFTVTATPKGDQAKDTMCGTFTYVTALGAVTKTPTTTGCWQ
jgi:type IV pilus assembly protein PilE